MYQEYLHHKNTPMCVCIYLHEYECVYVSIFIIIYSCARVHQLSIFSVISMFQVRIRQAQESVSDPDSPDKKMGSPKLSKLSCPEAER
jgi:hypothetical protein